MDVVPENPEIYDASLEGGISPQEARKLTELDSHTLENGVYDPSDIPALAGQLEKSYNHRENAYIPVDDVQDYVAILLERPEEVISDWDTGGYPFENNGTSIREKRDEYTIRTVYAFQDAIDQQLIDKTLRTIVNRPDYRLETAETLDEGNLGLLLGQYMNQIKELTDNQTILEEAYGTVAETPEASVAAAANTPVNELPEEVLENINLGGKEISSDQITTRLRNMQGAGRCEDLENNHSEVLLDEEPTRNTSLISFENELVGSLKHTGDTSMLALQDMTYNGRHSLQKGMAYRVSHHMLGGMTSERIDTQKPSHHEWEEVFRPGRMDEKQEKYLDWELKEVDRLELRPLRFAGEKGDQTVQEFRDQIETMRKQLEEQLEDF